MLAKLLIAKKLSAFNELNLKNSEIFLYLPLDCF